MPQFFNDYEIQNPGSKLINCGPEKIFLLFLVCHNTAFLFSTRATTALELTSECSPRYDNLV